MRFQSIRNHKGFCLGIGVVVCAAVFICMLFLTVNLQTISAIDILKNQNLEDFYFIPNVSDKDVIEKQGDYNLAVKEINEVLADKFDFKYEDHNYKYIDGDNKYKCYSYDRKIDVLLLSEGTIPEKGQVLVNQKYLTENGLSIGQKIAIGNQNYVISGVAYFPDMIYPQVSRNSSGYDAKTEALVAMYNEDYEELDYDENLVYVGKFISENQIDEMRSDNRFSCLVSADENSSILSFINSKIVVHWIMVCVVIIIFSAITCLMVALLILGMIDAEMSQLGVLKAIGYTNRELSLRYLSLGVIYIIAGLLSTVMLWFVQPLYYKANNSIFELPTVEGRFPVGLITIVCLAVIILLTLFAVVVASIRLRQSALSLINKSAIKHKSQRSAKINIKCNSGKFLKDIRKIQTKTSTSSVVLILVAGFSVGTLLQMSFLIGNVTKNLAVEAIEGVNYKYDVRFNEKYTEIDETGLPYYGITTRLCDSNKQDVASVDLCLLDNEDQSLLELRNKKNEVIQVNNADGVVINEWMSLKYNLTKGDVFYLKIDGDDYKFKVAEISNAIYGNIIYFSMDKAIEKGILSMSIFNGILTNENITSGVAYQSATESIVENIENTNGVYEINSYIMLLSGLAIGIPLMLLSFMNIVKDSKKKIAIMKINGYVDKECYYTLIDAFRWPAYVGLVISMPYTYVLGKVLFNIISKSSTMILSLYINQYSIIITILGVMLLTEGFIFIFKKLLFKISYKELLEA